MITQDQIAELKYNEARRILRMVRKQKDLLVGQTTEGTVRLLYAPETREYAIKYINNTNPLKPSGRSRMRAGGIEILLQSIITIDIQE